MRSITKLKTIVIQAGRNLSNKVLRKHLDTPLSFEVVVSVKKVGTPFFFLMGGLLIYGSLASIYRPEDADFLFELRRS